MARADTNRGRAGVMLAAATVLTPRTAWALESAPDANTFGVLVIVVVALAAGVGVWASLRERREPDVR